MVALTFDPFREMDRLTSQMLGGPAARGPRWMPMDLYRVEDHFVVAVDLPSGLDVHTGAADGPHVEAALTVTFGGLKPVHALGDCGRVELIDIGLDLPESDLVGVEATDVATRWPVPHASDDKYTQGVTGVLAGSALGVRAV